MCSELKLNLWFETNYARQLVDDISHFHISHNAPYPPPPRAKFCITLVFHFSWVQPSQEKLKTMLTQNFGGQIRCIMGKVEMANSHVTYNRIVFIFSWREVVGVERLGGMFKIMWRWVPYSFQNLHWTSTKAWREGLFWKTRRNSSL